MNDELFLHIDQTPPDEFHPAAFLISPEDFEKHLAGLLRNNINDSGNATCFMALFGSCFQYAPGFGWFWFDGKYWRRGCDHMALLAASHTVKLRLAALDNHTVLPEKEYKSKRHALENCANMGGIRGMLTMAGAMLRKTAEGDYHPWLINTESGVVDLRTGSSTPHDAKLGMTGCVGIQYDPDARSELWEGTVKAVASDDDSVADFLQRIAGYACSGSVTAQRFFYFFGMGANGKSLLTDLWADVLGYGPGGYAVRLPSETVLGSRERTPGSPSPDILALEGKRLALFSEQAGDKPLNPERLKDLTGGDSLSARAPLRPPVTFKPTHTLIGCGNHLPLIHGSDYALWRRMVIVPFRNRFAPSNLPDRLREPEHLRAVFTWMVRGAVKVFKDGSVWTLPPVVSAASREYQTEADLVRQWIDDECEPWEGETVSGALFQSFHAWCDRNQEYQISHSLFTRRMVQLGYTKRKSDGKPLLRGIRLKSSAPLHGATDTIEYPR